MYGVKWIYFDLDGTLIPENNEMSNRTIMASMYLKSKDIKVGIATGRSYYFSRHFAKALNVDLPLICLNGAWITKDGNYSTIKEEFINKFKKDEILKILNDNFVDYFVYTSDGVYSTSPNIAFFQKLKTISEEDKLKSEYKISTIDDRSKFYDMKIFKISIYLWGDDDRLKYTNMLKNIKGIKCICSQKNVLDVFDENIDKANSIKWLMEKENIKSHELMVFGDNENDIEMLKLAGKPVVMLNAKEKIKKYGKYKTDFSCENEGVADFIFKNF